MILEVKGTLLTEHIVTFSIDYKRLVIATGVMNTQNKCLQNNYSCYFKNFEILLPGRSRKDIFLSTNMKRRTFASCACGLFTVNRHDMSIEG